MPYINNDIEQNKSFQLLPLLIVIDLNLIWFKQEFIQDKIKIQWMATVSPASLLLRDGELIYTELKREQNEKQNKKPRE